MEPANAATVQGAFDGAEASHFNSRARFFRKGDAFLVETEGKDGKTAEFTIDYTFGFAPLQQYLTKLPDGRLQAQPFAWDTRAKLQGGQRWFHLYPGEAIPPGDILHWTGAQQNWNFMCADCHSTALRKRYDPATNTYATSFSEVSVGCESCHGPGVRHIAWANSGRDDLTPHKGFDSAAARRSVPDWTPDPVTGSPKGGVARPAGDEVETCGLCHSRRGQFSEWWKPGQPLADHYRPALLTSDLFEDDGQMKDEVFNYASFQQSKMHAKGVICSDCHDPHSGMLKAARTEICSTCHLPEKFAARSHTGHEAGPKQPDCVSCHMPVRTYMVVAPRHDHSFRIPRPDLSAVLGTPNACNDCHKDKTAAWAASMVERWHGPDRKGHQTYATAFHAARTGKPEARALLQKVASDPQTPAIARATSLTLLQHRQSAEIQGVFLRSLSDADPIVRTAALAGLEGLPLDQRWRHAAPALSDPVRLVRIQPASLLADGPPPGTAQQEREAFATAAAEFIDAERHNADRPEGRGNLARFFLRQGKVAEAEAEYLAALKLDFAVPVRVDLADLYRRLGREADAEALLRETIAMAPTAASAHHALGLAMVRAKRHGEALAALKQATELDRAQPRYAYVYAVALDSAGQSGESLRVLEEAVKANPSDTAIITLLVQNALRDGNPERALEYADRLHVLLPDDRSIANLARQLRAAVERRRRN